MMRISVCLLLGLVAMTTCEEIAISPVEGLLQTINTALPILRQLFYSVFGGVNKVAFRAAFAAAVELVKLAFPPLPRPSVPERWWGDRDRDYDTSIRRFTVHFSDEMISDLRDRILHRRNITHALYGAGDTYGTHSDLLTHSLDHWAAGYDFRARERWLNSFPQYVTNIQGLDVHYIHVKPLNPHGKKVLPLLLLHGWPVTAFEYVHVIQQLLVERDDCDFVFEMIAPDLPGFGYSEGTNQIGLAPYQVGIIMKNLMRRLGKPWFYIQAGDFGHYISDAIAVLFPERVLGIHTNLPFSIRPESLAKWVLGQLYPPAVVQPRYENRMYPLMSRLKSYLVHIGYFHLQATKPENIGHGLDECPVTLVSWLMNLVLPTDPGTVWQKYDIDDWFDTFTISWAAKCMTTSVRSYAESFAWLQNPLALRILTTPTTVPTAAICFRYEVIYQPDDLLRDKYPNLLQTITPDVAGHFAGFEQPVLLADSIRTAVAKMERYHANNGTSH